MINLLPPQEKSKLLLENQRKMIIILGLTFIIPLLCFMLLLFSVKLYILGELNFQKVILDQDKKEYQTADFLNFKGIIQKNNMVLIALHSFYRKEVYFADALQIFANVQRPQGLYVINVVLTRTQDQKIRATAYGFAGSRSDLLAFQRNMNENEEIKNVNFSPDSWISPQNVNFNVNFEIVPNH